jgi:ABC-type sugar transport system ATPase subunit
VAQFLGSPKINLLPYSLDVINERMNFGNNSSLACSQLEVPLSVLQMGQQLGVRPEAIRLCPVENGHMQGKIEFTEQLGDAAIVYVRLPWQQNMMTVKVNQQQISYGVGQMVGLQVDSSQVLIFNQEAQQVS